MEAVANLADQYGNGTILTTNSQNLILPNIPHEKIPQLLKEEVLQQFNPFEKSFSVYMMTCAGKGFCPFAITKTKDYIEPSRKYQVQSNFI